MLNTAWTCIFLIIILAVFVVLPSPGFALTKQFQWTARVTASEQYDDNINLDKNNEEDDWITAVGPGLTLAILMEKTEVRLDYDMAFVYYARNQDDNTVRHTLTLSGLENIPVSDRVTLDLDESFYAPFLEDSVLLNHAPDELFTPWQNQFIKYLKVFREFVIINNSSTSQLNDFMEGYFTTFPSEEVQIRKIYKEVMGTEFGTAFPSPLWLLVKDYEHRLLVFDPFGAITVPLYTFDLNAAEMTDLLTIQGITNSEAKKILDHRNEFGYFSALDEVKSINGLSEGSVNRIMDASLDEQQFEELLKDFDLQLNLGMLIIKPLGYLLKRTLMYFLLLAGFLYFFTKRKELLPFKKGIKLFSSYFLLWIVFVIAGMGLVLFLPQPIIQMGLFTAVITLFSLIIYRKNKFRLTRSIIAVWMMGIFIMASLM
jgi:hypothetical protein